MVKMFFCDTELYERRITMAQTCSYSCFKIDKIYVAFPILFSVYHFYSLREKNADQLKAINPDPVVSRKIQIKLQNLMHQSFNKYKDVMDGYNTFRYYIDFVLF